MKLLFDQNLSHHLCAALADLFPGSAHVRDLGLAGAADTEVWETARKSGFVLVSKDSDFHQRSFLLGAPPKVIWIRTGNCSTARLQTILRTHAGAIARFIADSSSSFLELG